MTLKQRDQFFRKRLPAMVRNLLCNALHNLRHPGMRDGVYDILNSFRPVGACHLLAHPGAAPPAKSFWPLRGEDKTL
jgi:hypothetical protein